MPVRSDLINEIRTIISSLGASSLSTAADSDIFEAYTFSLVIAAARAEGGVISFRDVLGATPSNLIFRSSPGYIFSRRHPYTHAVIEFQNKPALEAHIGIYVSGTSEVLHESDVAVIHQTEGNVCRNSQVSPRASKTIIAVECKFYSTNIPLKLGREFIGLTTDLSAKECYFVTNSNSDSVNKLLTKKNKNWQSKIVPSSFVDVERLRNSFQDAFKKYKAK